MQENSAIAKATVLAVAASSDIVQTNEVLCNVSIPLDRILQVLQRTMKPE